MHLITSIVRFSITTLVYFAQILHNMLTIVTEYHPGFSSSVASNSNHAQGDPLEMAINEIGLTPLLEMMIEFVADIESAKFAKFAKCETIQTWWNNPTPCLT